MKRILALLLCLLMVLSLVACASEPTTAPSTDTPSTTPSEPAETPADEPAEAPADEPADEPTVAPADEPVDEPAEEPVEEPAETISLPLTEDMLTYTAFYYATPEGGIDNWNQSYAYQELEKRTNVHMDFFHVSPMSAFEQFALSIGSGDWYDTYIGLIYFYSAGGFDYYIDEEIILDLADMIPTYAPDYLSVIQEDDPTYLATITDSGYMPGVYQIAQRQKGNWFGPVFRTDLLAKAGLSMPTTYDEVHNALTAMQDLGYTSPMLLDANGMADWLMNGFDVHYATDSTNYAYAQKDGQVEYCLTNQNFKDYLTLMNQWYSEGLIYPDFYSATDAQDLWISSDPTSSITLGSAYFTFLEEYGNMSGIEGYYLEAMPNPVKEAGQELHFRSNVAMLNRSKMMIGTITTTCENPEILLQWYNYLYTDEGALLANYGVEGQGFNYDENGEPKLSELVTNDANGQTLDAMYWVYTANSVLPFYYNEDRGNTAMGENEVACEAIWDTNIVGDWMVPNVSFSIDENGEILTPQADIQTYVAENVVKFIIGERSLNEFDAFCADIEALGLEKVDAAMQAALNRYYARDELVGK